MKSDPNSPSPKPVDDAVSALVEGRSVDWARAMEASGGGKERHTLEVLRVLARVQELTRPDEVQAPGRWGALEIVETLGSGGFASVHRALDPVLGLEVALKVLHRRGEKAREEIIGEGRLLARVRHPNVVRIFGVEELQGRVGLRMELIQGRSLDRIVREDGVLGPIESTRIGLDVCRALAAVHREGLVHRDVKAQNVMREDDGRVVLMDLGASAEADSSGGRVTEKQEGGAQGTPLYLAPEILDGQPASPGTDLYALGVLLFFLVTGRFPVEASNLDEVRKAHESSSWNRLEDLRPDLPASLLRVVERATQPDPQKRFVSAPQMAQALASALSVSEEWSAKNSDEPTPSRPSGNLPPSFTRFVGRRDSLEAVGALLRGNRVVTLVGPGGCGKTRLSLELGHLLQETFEDGVWFIPLASARNAGEVIRVFGDVFGVREAPREALLDGVARVLQPHRALLLVDNCEHVAQVVASVVTQLRARTSSIVFGLTSRIPLGIAGEVTYSVSPLEVDGLSIEAEAGDTSEAEITKDALATVMRNEAVQLFVDRARAVHANFEIGPENATSIARICRELDGLPLALELAAAQTRAIPVNELGRRLRDRLDLLRSEAIPEPAHHQTLLSSIDWSYDLLTEEGRAVLRCVSLFSGGWTLEAAESVIPEAVGIPEREVLPALSSLVSGSLVHLSGADAAEHRYDLLDTVREYARRRLEEDGSRRATARAFLRHYGELARRMNASLLGSGDVKAMGILSAEQDNIRAACGLALELGELTLGLSLVSQLGRFWMTGGFFMEGREVCAKFLEHPESPARTAERASVASWLAVFTKQFGDTEGARRWWSECLEIWREKNDRKGVASVLNGLGTLEYDARHFPEAIGHFEQSLAIRRELRELRGIAQSLMNLGLCHAEEGDLDRAIERIDEARSIHEGLGNAFGVAKTLGEVGFIQSRQGLYKQAVCNLEKAVTIQATVGPNVVLPCRLGFAYLWAGSLEEAKKTFLSALRVFGPDDLPVRPSQALHGLALVAQRQGQEEFAARLLGAASIDSKRVLMSWEDREVSKLRTLLRSSLGGERFDSILADGNAHSDSFVDSLVEPT